MVSLPRFALRLFILTVLVDQPSTQDEWIGIISGLEIGSTSPADGQIQMLVEYLTGEAGGIDDQTSASQISRLIIAGNSLAPIPVTGKGEGEIEDKKAVSVYLNVTVLGD